MSKLLVKPKAKSGLMQNVTPESAGWTYVGFGLNRLKAGEVATGESADRETCLVLVAGKARISVDGEDFGELGERMTPFEGQPNAVYVPKGSRWQATATSDLDLAICSAPGVITSTTSSDCAEPSSSGMMLVT